MSKILSSSHISIRSQFESFWYKNKVTSGLNNSYLYFTFDVDHFLQ